MAFAQIPVQPPNCSLSGNGPFTIEKCELNADKCGFTFEPLELGNIIAAVGISIFKLKITRQPKVAGNFCLLVLYYCTNISFQDNK